MNYQIYFITWCNYLLTIKLNTMTGMLKDLAVVIAALVIYDLLIKKMLNKGAA